MTEKTEKLEAEAPTSAPLPPLPDEAKASPAAPSLPKELPPLTGDTAIKFHVPKNILGKFVKGIHELCADLSELDSLRLDQEEVDDFDAILNSILEPYLTLKHLPLFLGLLRIGQIEMTHIGKAIKEAKDKKGGKK